MLYNHKRCANIIQRLEGIENITVSKSASRRGGGRETRKDTVRRSAAVRERR